VNRLAGETSPYLRQHADNPVDWQPWGAAAFDEAVRRDRPVLLSIGYSACHWCHVMAHESFEDADTAAIMNEMFVCVKVDREERPDVDSVYMDAVQAISGRGGWPMTVFLMPDGKPFFGGTYYPRETFHELMTRIDEVWRDQRSELTDQASHLTDAIAQSAVVAPSLTLPGLEELNAALVELASRFDPTWGGFGGAPKFPTTMSLDLILRAYSLNPSDDALAVVSTSLDAMCSGGMYDHLGGGFARYSTDEKWLVPHFEKMLYDQALLLRLYVHGWQVTGNARWRQVAAETVEYLLRDLAQPEGGFSSAEDADSPDASGHMHEGLFQTFTPDEVRALVGTDEDAARFCEWFAISEAGNFDGRSIPNRMHARGSLARPADVEALRVVVFAARETRPRPGLDDKVLTEWNALVIGALAEAGAALGEPTWIDAARRCASFLCDTLRVDGQWRRSWQRDGGARHDALAADHAALVEAFVALWEATGEARWITEARDVAELLLDNFWDSDNGGVFTTSHTGEQLVARQKDLMDNATPSANSMATVGLLRLSAITSDRRYQEHANRILRLAATIMPQAPSAFSYMLAGVDITRAGMTEIVIAGDRPDLVSAASATYRPRAVLAWGERFDSPLWGARKDGFAYVCKDYTCKAPVDTLAAFVAQL
jgi:uncharacterized protein